VFPTPSRRIGKWVRSACAKGLKTPSPYWVSMPHEPLGDFFVHWGRFRMARD
jgi:hypothetical protein